MKMKRRIGETGKSSGRMEKEVWVWDLAGQPDYRLVHQLFMDQTSLGVVVFDPQDDNPFEELGYWEKALARAASRSSEHPHRHQGHDPQYFAGFAWRRGGL